MGDTVLEIQTAESLAIVAKPSDCNWSILRSLSHQEVEVRRGDAPVAAGSPSQYCFLVLEGALRIWRPLADGRRQITAFAFPGDWVGFDDAGEANVCVEAVTPVRAERYLLRSLQMAAAADAAVAEALRDLLRSRIKAAQERILILGHKNTREKLASFILEMANRLAGDGNMVPLPMSRHDIADYLGMSHETACRNFTHLVADQIIALPAPNQVHILQRGNLEFIAI
jgi:CRP-like cAMP-binding protein